MWLLRGRAQSQCILGAVVTISKNFRPDFQTAACFSTTATQGDKRVGKKPLEIHSYSRRINKNFPTDQSLYIFSLWCPLLSNWHDALHVFYVFFSWLLHETGMAFASMVMPLAYSVHVANVTFKFSIPSQHPTTANFVGMPAKLALATKSRFLC